MNSKLQFRTRSLFLVFTSACFASGIAFELSRRTSRMDAVRSIESVGGEFNFETDYRQAGEDGFLSLSDRPVHLLLQRAYLTAGEISHEAEFSDDTIDLITRIHSLRSVTLSYGGWEIGIMRKYFDHKLTDEGIAKIAKLKHLTDLQLCSLPVSNKTMEAIGTLRNLKILNVNGSQVSDSALQFIRDSEQLTWLDLSGTNITRDGLHHLKPLRNLEMLILFGIELNEDDLKDLRESLPDCRILHSTSAL